MNKDIEFYKKQEASLLKRIDTLKQEIDKLLLKNTELKEKLTLNGVVSSFSIGFAEYIAKKHYKLLNFIGKIHYWGNGESYKTSEQLLKDYKETIS